MITVLTAGLVLGDYGREHGMSATTQVAVNSFWEYAAFVVNSQVFLLIGLEIRLPAITQNFKSALWAILALLIARVVTVYGLMPLVNLHKKQVPARWQYVLFWGGLRGSLFDRPGAESLCNAAWTGGSDRHDFRSGHFSVWRCRA